MPSVHGSRIDTFELKLQLESRIGSQKAENYFNLLTRYLSLKLKKSEFNKLCVGLIGRENVRLHNELIKAIVINANFSKTPPPNRVKHDSQLSSKVANVARSRTGLQSIFPQSPKKIRTPSLRERKFKDRASPLGFHEKTQEQQSATELFSLGSKPPIEVTSVEDGEEVDQNAISPGVHSRSPVQAPFGVTIHSKETRKLLSIGSSSSHTETCHYTGQLPPTSSLANRLKHKLKMEGLDISMDCSNLLNNGLDSFLKRVIKPSLKLASSRCLKNPNRSFSPSMLDLRVVTETNPKILGEDWPVQLEKALFFDLEHSTGMQQS
ncbi:hypothetical protein E3N88_30106 [Mikania micrantha]|uniref:Transcriptional coactivator Hfi1/Transcriptional adapter 1 n=1 Tax=Mikania micrantha TaxID=192012 RepID=A0A5N6ML45_9ASTR|nr:hypothetical protein E3N88_30106 [Mikania micrantha]